MALAPAFATTTLESAVTIIFKAPIYAQVTELPAARTVLLCVINTTSEAVWCRHDEIEESDE